MLIWKVWENFCQIVRMWKLQNFSVSQNLREIKGGEFGVAKYRKHLEPEPLDFNFYEYLHFWRLQFPQRKKNQRTKNCTKWHILYFYVLQNWIHIKSDILTFLHCGTLTAANSKMFHQSVKVGFCEKLRQITKVGSEDK